jgi:hypothetical protein
MSLPAFADILLFFELLVVGKAMRDCLALFDDVAGDAGTGILGEGATTATEGDFFLSVEQLLLVGLGTEGLAIEVVLKPNVVNLLMPVQLSFSSPDFTYESLTADEEVFD